MFGHNTENSLWHKILDINIFRKRILQNLMSDPSRTVEIVNDLNKCEVEIRMLKDEIEAQSQLGK